MLGKVVGNAESKKVGVTTNTEEDAQAWSRPVQAWVWEARPMITGDHHELPLACDPLCSLSKNPIYLTQWVPYNQQGQVPVPDGVLQKSYVRLPPGGPVHPLERWKMQ